MSKDEPVTIWIRMTSGRVYEARALSVEALIECIDEVINSKSGWAGMVRVSNDSYVNARNIECISEDRLE